MIYIKSFKNYEEFKELFGVREMGNGNNTRKNKILLACLKDKTLFKWWLGFGDECRKNGYKMPVCSYLYARDMSDLKIFIKTFLFEYTCIESCLKNKTQGLRPLRFGQLPYKLYSSEYHLDNFNGLCIDGDAKSVRYVKVASNKVYKMKAGKFISRVIECSCMADIMPEQMKRWISEEFARDWESFASSHVGNGNYKLHVDDNFFDIYSSDMCVGDFHSCMTDQDQYSFYENSVDCKAAYLTDINGGIVARCILFQDVWDKNGNHYRLAERQYATDNSDLLKQTLVDKLIAAKAIDGYKTVGAGCHDRRSFVLNDGTSLTEKTLYIRCNLAGGDTLSFQDSFAYYDINVRIACNRSDKDFTISLDTVDSALDPSDVYWSEFNERYLREDEAVYDNYYDDYILEEQAANAIYDGRDITICESRAQEDDKWVWSGEQGVYIYFDEAVYVESRGDYFRSVDCVEDVHGKMQRQADCVYSWSLEGYVAICEAIWSKYDGDYTAAGSEFYSEITDECYCSEQSMLDDEREYRKKHAVLIA